MKLMKRQGLKSRRMATMASLGKYGRIMRRTANQTAHVITAHGKVQSGRKGRKG